MNTNQPMKILRVTSEEFELLKLIMKSPDIELLVDDKICNDELDPQDILIFRSLKKKLI